MSVGTCSIPECTVAVTGVCLKSFPPSKCPHREGLDEKSLSTEEPNEGELEQEINDSEETVSVSDTADQLAAAIERSTDTTRPLPRSGTLRLDAANRLINERTACTIGIVGLPDSGKTACLVSLYLLLSKNELPGFIYSNSESLMAFEDISKGSRQWNDGSPPEQMTSHTEMAEEDRIAGFLHLRLLRISDHQRLDLLIPDLPGEWSTALIDRNETARFEFLKSVSVIWLMVDGRKFNDPNSVSFEIHRAKCALQRLAEFLSCPRPRVILVMSWLDIGAMPEDALSRIKAEGTALNIEIEVISIASFSQNVDVLPGTGIASLIESTLSTKQFSSDFWADSPPKETVRSLIAFRRML